MNSEKYLQRVEGIISRAFFMTVVACLILLVGAPLCFATTITLQWGSSTGATGYKVYYQADSSTQPFTGTGATQGASPVDVKREQTKPR